MRHGACGAVCSAGSRPSASQRRIVCVQTIRRRAASLMDALAPERAGPGGGDAGPLADTGDAGGGEGQAGGGQPALLYEHHRDLGIGGVLGEAADQLNQVLAPVGALRAYLGRVMSTWIESSFCSGIFGAPVVPVGEVSG
jgi:hypothetical protein